MSDASLGGPVEYDPTDPHDTQPLLSLIPETHQCYGINVDNTRCLRRVNHDREYCIAHEPNPDMIIGLLYRRLQTFAQNCAACGPATAEELITLSHVAKAFGVLWDRKVTMDEAKKVVQAVGWRMEAV